jgi:hypothetical protein
VNQDEQKLWVEGFDLPNRYEPFTDAALPSKHASAFYEYLGHERLRDIASALGFYLKAGFPKPETTQYRFWVSSCFGQSPETSVSCECLLARGLPVQRNAPSLVTVARAVAINISTGKQLAEGGGSTGCSD